jgi:ABC-2 type transport system ATP-binding protein
MKDIIVLEGLTKHYGSLLAVDHVSLNIGEGEFFGLLGPNGAGKTTTIRMLVGLTTPSEGAAIVNGYDIREDSVKVKACIGVVPETSNLYDELTVWHNIVFMAGMYHVPRKERKTRVEDLLKTFSLTDRKGAKFGKLSRGLKRRVTIAAALVHDPKILFLDEPTSGLDVMSARALRRLLKQLREQGVTVFLTTHYIEEADQLCDRIAIIVKGKIVAFDTPEHLKTVVQGAPIVEASFNRMMESSIVKQLDAFGQVEVKGNMIRVQAKNASETIKVLTNFAEERSLEIVYMNTVRPSLEDAFVRLTGVESEAMKMDKERRGS